jgi:hypothetical protein
MLASQPHSVRLGLPAAFRDSHGKLQVNEAEDAAIRGYLTLEMDVSPEC